MDWNRIHEIAEEIELWSTLILNLWVLTGGVLVALSRVINNPKPITRVFVIAARFSLDMVIGAVLTVLLILPVAAFQYFGLPKFFSWLFLTVAVLLSTNFAVMTLIRYFRELRRPTSD